MTARDPVLVLDGISVAFGGVVALDGVSMTVERSSVHGVIGANGAGKTTLLNVISGLFRPRSGSMAVDRDAGGPWPMEQAARRGIARTFQQPRAFMGVTVDENLRLARLARGAPADAGWEERVVELFELGPLRRRRAQDLGFGELRRVSIALALLHKPSILLLDEPTVGLAEREVEGLAGLVATLAREEVTVLLVEHNMPFLMSAVSHVTALERGRVIFDGEPSACQRDPDVIRSYLGVELDAVQG